MLACSSFAQLVVHLRDENVIRATQQCFYRLHLLAIYSKISPYGGHANSKVNTRVILAAYMVVYHPTSVFEQMGELETTLCEAAGNLLRGFNAIMTCIAQHGSFFAVPAALIEPFSGDIFAFLNAFQAWKDPDAQKLTIRIQHAMVALAIAWGQIPANEPDNSLLRTEYRTEFARLRVKLIQYGGALALETLLAQLHAQNIPEVPAPL